MSRPIKFRGRPKDGSDWLYGSLIHFGGSHYAIVSDDKYRHPGHMHFDVEVGTVGQYIGLKDDNGVEIYTGDVAWFYSHTCKGEVSYVPEKGFGIVDGSDGEFVPFADIYYIRDSLVIGNIFDNPELLEYKR